ncbi:MAG: hypothetical protein EZS28_014002 [Streblomastix strix]|uniref:Right handed beta helix domain-containing protein n=1 Tax=Streblomastix strix TaxID=222440 RepID=A0A5J4W695_9EUKA|nr:MAG: hypothetical protein EZS28_014002 [Streblomastix strix]
MQISFELAGTDTECVYEKIVGITEGGCDLINRFQYNSDSIHTNSLKIVKQLYQTTNEMTDNAKIRIMKLSGPHWQEYRDSGWIALFGQMNLSLFCIDIFQGDEATLNIPVIYMDGQNSSLVLDSVSFSAINLEAAQKGVIHMVVDNSEFAATNCIFENISYTYSCVSIIRFESTTQPTLSPVKAIISGCKFKNISGQGDSNSRGGSAINAEIGKEENKKFRRNPFQLLS